MNILNQSPANGINGHSAFPASQGPRSSRHHLQPSHRDSCRHPRLLPVALPSPPATLPSASSTSQCLVQPCRSSCRSAPLVGNKDGGSPNRDEPQIHRSVDHDAVRVTSMRDIWNNLPYLQLDGGGEEMKSLINLPAEPASIRYHHTKGVQRRSSASSAADDVELVSSLMNDGRYFSQRHEYHGAPGSHFDRQQQQQVFSSPDHHEKPPRGVVALEVSVSSAVKLESKQMDQIAKKMRKLTGLKSLRMESTVDPSLIAGFVIRYGMEDAHVIDLSVKGRLAELEARLQSSDQSTGDWSFLAGKH